MTSKSFIQEHHILVQTIEVAHIFFLTFFSKVFHVRSVTQGDVIRAEAKDIPRIFQVSYYA